MNLDKTTILPIHTDQTSYLQEKVPNITIKEQYENIKILGLIFCEDLKEAIRLNWLQTLQKKENHINKLSSRKLSFFGKAIILNTLMLPKIKFLSNVFPIPENTLTQIHKYIFEYIWHNKKRTQSKENTIPTKRKRRTKYKRT